MKLICTINQLPRMLLIAAYLLLNALFYTHAIADDIVKMDRIIAIVDKDVITEQELANKVRTVSNQLENKESNSHQSKCSENKY